MTATKPRTLIATLVATFAFAVATAPVAHATKNDGGYSESSEAKRKKFCDTLQDSLDESRINYRRAMSGRMGRKQQAKEIQKSINGLLILGDANGCGLS